MTDLTADVGKTLNYLEYSKEGSVLTRLLPLEQISRFAGSRITVNERFAFSFSNKGTKLEYHPKIHIN